MSLNEKQQRFSQEYVKDLNGTQAAIRAGYSRNTAEQQASRLLSNVKVQDCIKELQKEIRKRNEITIDECVGILTDMARVDISKAYKEDGTLKNIHDIPEDVRRAIEAIESDEKMVEGKLLAVTKKVKFSNRRANVIELLKYLGGYKKDNEQKGIPVRQIVNMSDYKKDG